MPVMRALTWWALLAATLPPSLCAQAPGVEVAGGDARTLLFSTAWPAPQESAPGPDLGPAAFSLLLPGAGQHMLGQNRKWIYAGLEVLAWVVFLERRSAGADYRDQYEDYAWEEGRIQNGPRVDGDFDYYETLSKWVQSGAYDEDAMQAGLQPETDPATYNGSIWALAQQIYIPGGGPVPETDPAYQSALAYYAGRAYATEFLWDWSGAPGGQEQLGGLIEASDDRFRQATTALGVVIGNHLISAADAYLSSRGRRIPARMSLAPSPHGSGGGWSTVLSIPVGQ